MPNPIWRSTQEGSMRSSKCIVNQAKLISSTPDQIIAFLKEQASIPSDIKDCVRATDVETDEELEDALLQLDQPLVNLALARYGFSTKVRAELFNMTATSEIQRQALRLE